MEKVFDYARCLIGIPYRWHQENEKIQENDKFWASNNNAPSPDEIRESNKSIVCTGLINLMRRFQNLSVPGLNGSFSDEGSKFPGTTGIWFLYLSQKKRLEVFDSQKKYPQGTLLLRNFFSMQDQGHVAVVFTQLVYAKSCLDEYIIHSYAELPYGHVGDAGLVGLTKLYYSHYSLSEGYYTHVCLPENWLLKD